MPRAAFAKALFLALFFASQSAFAQGEVIDRIGDLFDSISRSLRSIGEKSEDLIPPGIDSIAEQAVDTSGLQTLSDEREETLPAAPNATVSITNEFGEIYVESWDNPVVRVQTEIYVGAENVEMARQVIEDTTIDIQSDQNSRIDIHTIYPDTRGMNVVTEVKYRVNVPRGASLRCSNLLGDTIVRGTGGSVEVDAVHGGVNLFEIGGPVKVRARGDFPLYAESLRAGGEFELVWMGAEFRNVAGELLISNYMGSIDVAECSQATNVTIRCRNGPLTYALGEGARPDLTATVLFGQLQNEANLEQTVRRNVTEARIANVDARQKIGIYAAFSDVTIRQAGAAPAPAPSNAAATESVRGEVARVVPLDDNAEIVVNAIVGNIIVEGTDEDSVQVTGEQLVRVESSQQALAALEALAVDVTQTAKGVEIRTRELDDMAALGASYYRVDLKIQCPAGTQLRIRAASGNTAIRDLAATVNIEQAQGTVSIERVEGPVNARNQSGDVTVVDSSGPLTATAQSGEIRTRTVSGGQTLVNTDGKTIIDAPGGEVTARNSGGDIRIIALDGIHGAYDIWVNQGNISIVRPDWADAEFIVTVEGGDVDTVVPLVGELSRQRRDFRGRQGEGTHKVTLNATNGDVVID